MVEFKPGMKKEELLAIAAANGVAVDGSMAKAAIIDALNAHNAAEAAETPAGGATAPAGSAAGDGGTDDTTHGETPAEQPAEGAEDGGGSGTGDDDKTPAEGATEGAEEYDTFVYVGPSIPRGRLKENAVFRGTRSDVLEYLADVVEQYPQIPRLIVPTNRLAAFSVKVKTPGNIANKYYSDIASAIRRGKEV